MIEHREEDLQETWYSTVLSNGLNVVLFCKPLFVSSCAILAGRCGSFDHILEDDQGHRISLPYGTAHFLEHKMFESRGSDAMNEFSLLGASVNAWTSMEETAYYFTSQDSDISAPLRLLLKLGQSFDISPDSVEKEKGIILEELHSYQQDPDTCLMQETMRSLYRKHPIREDVTGTDESIKQMTRDDLWQLFQADYHPSQMVLVIVSPTDPGSLLALIEKEEQQFSFPCRLPMHRIIEPEQDPVIAEKTLHMDTQTPRQMLGYRLRLPDGSAKEALEQEWRIRIILESVFTPLNPQYQSWIDEGKITPLFGWDLSIEKNLSYLTFFDETAADDFQRFIAAEMTSIRGNGVDEQLLKQLKKRSLGDAIQNFNDPVSMAMSALEGELEGVSMFEELAIVRNLSSAQCMRAFANLDLSDVTLTRILPD